MTPVDSAHYEVVFDVLLAGYRQWWFPAAGVPFVVVGIALLLGGSRMTRGGGALLHTLGATVVTLGILWVGGALASTYADYAHLRDRLRSGQYMTVEGAVTNFVPGDLGDHRQESFTVAGHHFSYAPSIVTAGFNRSAAHGGPIAEGMRVRIAAVDGEIARLEIITESVRDSKCGRSKPYVWVVTEDSVGPIPATSSLEEVRRLCPGARDVMDSLVPYSAVAIPGFDSKLLVAETEAAVPSGRMSVIIVRTPLVRTREGLGVGSTLADLRQALGPMLVLGLNEQGFFAVPRSRRNSRVQYRLDGFDPAAVPGGWTPADTAAQSDLVPGTARLAEIQVWSRPT